MLWEMRLDNRGMGVSRARKTKMVGCWARRRAVLGELRLGCVNPGAFLGDMLGHRGIPYTCVHIDESQQGKYRGNETRAWTHLSPESHANPHAILQQISCSSWTLKNRRPLFIPFFFSAFRSFAACFLCAPESLARFVGGSSPPSLPSPT